MTLVSCLISTNAIQKTREKKRSERSLCLTLSLTKGGNPSSHELLIVDLSARSEAKPYRLASETANGRGARATDGGILGSGEPGRRGLLPGAQGAGGEGEDEVVLRLRCRRPAVRYREED